MRSTGAPATPGRQKRFLIEAAELSGIHPLFRADRSSALSWVARESSVGVKTETQRGPG